MECQACRKFFASENSYENHLKSKKHLENETSGLDEPKLVVKSKAQANLELNKDSYLDKDATEEQIREALESKLSMARRLKPEECIFCNHSFESFDVSMDHMVKNHGLYIPDLEFVEDLPGMVSYLADKVSVAFCCLYCNASVQPFTSIESVRRHMLDKGHLKIRFDDEGMQELADFYNYEEILSDDGDEEFVDVDEDRDDNGDFDSALVISPDETELILPSGKRLGNRAYRKYYKQNLPVEREERPSRRSEHQALISRMSDHYLAAGMMQPAAERKFVIDQRRDNERRKEWDQKVSVSANKLQEYFRIQLRQ
jgi:pre-60S factor REI1